MDSERRTTASGELLYDARSATLPSVWTTAKMSVFTDMCMYLRSRKKKTKSDIGEIRTRCLGLRSVRVATSVPPTPTAVPNLGSFASALLSC